MLLVSFMPSVNSFQCLNFHAQFPGNVASGSSNIIQESIWEEVFPLLDKHFFQLVPGHLYEQFLDNVLCALEIAGHFDITGKQLMQYIILFFPKVSDLETP